MLHNAYVTWLPSWALVSNALASNQFSYWDIYDLKPHIPKPLIALLAIAALISGINLVISLWRRARKGTGITWNGVVAYGVSLYPWLLWRHPVMLLWYPMLHSLQALAVMWRFEISRAYAIQSPERPILQLALFSNLGLLLGFLGFWSLPQWLNTHVGFSKKIFGPSLLLVAFWIFINIHHYFMDSAMWRSGNRDVEDHLFNSPSPHRVGCTFDLANCTPTSSK